MTASVSHPRGTLGPMEMEEIERLAEMALPRFGLADWTFRWDRSVRRAGCCKYDKRQITLSRPIFEIEANRDEAIDTFLHEIAHALAGPTAGHGPTWRYWAETLEISTERCHHLELPPPPVVGTCDCDGPPHGRSRMPSARYVYRCRSCRAEVVWSRRDAA